MAKNSNRPPQAASSKQQVQRTGTPPPVKKLATTESGNPSPYRLHGMLIAAISVVTFIAMRTSLANQFTNWDDPGYVVNNPIIKDLSGEGLKAIFSTPIMGNYHPLTILTYAFDYAFSALDPFSFHLQSLLFHIATTALVYCFVLLLSRKVVAAVVTALLFGIHPMHVESVAWVAGRKDVVYGFFYVGACITYLFYLRNTSGKKGLWYGITLLSFIASILAKPVAVSLPVTLFVIDYFEGRNWKLPAVYLDKLIFFALSIAAGIRSLKDQKVFGALNTQSDHYDPLERIALGGYAFIQYLWKAILPVKLLCLYPYPLKENGHMPAVYYIYPLLSLLLLGAVVYFFRKNKVVIGGIAFFIANIALLLQFIPVGGAIIADRYSYIPYIGLFFIIGMGIAHVANNTPAYAKIAMGGIGVYALMLCYLTHQRCQVWYDAFSLWRDEIEVEPVKVPSAYNNLGFSYYERFNNSVDPAERKLYYDSSLFLLTRAIQLQETFVNPYISMGELLRSNGQYAEAKRFYYKALQLNKDDMAANTYLGLSITYSIAFSLSHSQLDHDSALYCYMRTLQLKPYYPEAHSNYANFLDMNGMRDSALVHYGLAIQQNPDIVPPYLNRGRALQRANRCYEAMKDFERAIAMQPDMGELYYARSVCYANSGKIALAKQDVQKALSLGFRNMDAGYVKQLGL